METAGINTATGTVGGGNPLTTSSGCLLPRTQTSLNPFLLVFIYFNEFYYLK